MSTTTITQIFKAGSPAVLADATSVVFSDPTGTIGLVRTDTGASVLAAGTPLVRTAVGTYTYALTDPAQGLTYAYWVKVTFNGTPYYQQKISEAPAAGNSYLSVTEADALASSLPSKLLAAYLAANGPDKFAALQQATLEVDDAFYYQGRPYAADQPRDFPRVAYESSAGAGALTSPAGVVWDWDCVNHVAIVPTAVLQATLYQANSILDGGRDGRLDEIHDGVRQSINAGLQEAYSGSAPGADTGLCRRAYQLLYPYKLVSGRQL